MRHNIKRIIKRELLVQNRVYNLNKYLIVFFLFSAFSITLINSHENIQKFGIIFSVISIPLAFISLPTNIIKPDIEDGSLELMLLLASSSQIAIGKFSALVIASLTSFLVTMPIIYFVFNIPFLVMINIIICGILMTKLAAALIVLIASVQGYFRSNTNFLSVLIMPLIIPTIILSGILLQNPENLSLIWIMLGINLVVIPVSLYLSGYLIENIYNI